MFINKYTQYLPEIDCAPACSCSGSLRVALVNEPVYVRARALLPLHGVTAVLRVGGLASPRYAASIGCTVPPSNLAARKLPNKGAAVCRSSFLRQGMALKTN